MDVAISRIRVVVAMVVILGWAAVAHAEDAPQAPAGTRALADTPFQLVLPQAYLLGDWYGVRTWLEDRRHPDRDVRHRRPRQSDGRHATRLHLYIVAFAMSWGPVMWVLLREMFPNRMRGAALAVFGATNWVANFAVTVTFLPLLTAVGLSGA